MHNIIEGEGIDNDKDDFNYDDMGEKGKISHDGAPELDEFIQITRTFRTRKLTHSFKPTLLSTCGKIN
jgi:hypothetical protein